jgi:hypothetical protein
MRCPGNASLEIEIDPIRRERPPVLLGMLFVSNCIRVFNVHDLSPCGERVAMPNLGEQALAD